MPDGIIPPRISAHPLPDDTPCVDPRLSEALVPSEPAHRCLSTVPNNNGQTKPDESPQNTSGRTTESSIRLRAPENHLSQMKEMDPTHDYTPFPV